MKQLNFILLLVAATFFSLNAQISINLPTEFVPYKVPGNIRGANISANSNLLTINNPSFLAEFPKLNMGTFRWPGGTNANNYNWKKGLQDNGKFNLRMAAQFSQNYNIDINYVLNYGTTTAHEAAELVRICNSTGAFYDSIRSQFFGIGVPLNVKVWEIGNELGASWEWHVSWLSGGNDQYIYYRTGQSKSMPRLVTDSMHYFGGVLWRAGWVPTSGNMTKIDAVLGTPYWVTQMDGDTVTVEVKFGPIYQDSVVVWAVNSVLDKQYLIDSVSQQNIYNGVTMPQWKLSASEFEILGDTSVRIYPNTPLGPGMIFLVEYKTMHPGAFEIRDSMIAADPSLEIGYCIDFRKNLLGRPAFDARLQQSPPRFIVEHPYNTGTDPYNTGTDQLLNNGFHSEIIYKAERKRNNNYIGSQGNLDSIVAAMSLPNAIGFGLTEWNIRLCGEGNCHPGYNGMLGGLYAASFYTQFYQAAKAGEVDLRVNNHFASIASGNNLIHLFHYKPATHSVEVSAQANAIRMVNEAIGENYFDFDSVMVTGNPMIEILDMQGSMLDTLSLPAVRIFGGIDSLNSTLNVLLLNTDDASDYTVQLNIPGNWLVDSVFIESMSGNPLQELFQLGKDTLLASNQQVSLNLDTFGMATLRFPFSIPESPDTLDLDTTLLGVGFSGEYMGEQFLPLLDELGIGHHYITIKWGWFEPTLGQYQDSILDVFLNQLPANSNALIRISPRENLWANDSLTDYTVPIDLSVGGPYYNFFRHIVERDVAGKVKYFENEWEFNLAKHWGGQTNPNLDPIDLGLKYAELTRTSEAAINDANSSAQFILGATNRNTSNYADTLLRTALHSLNQTDSIRGHCDYYDQHLYRDMYTIADDLNWFRSIMSDYAAFANKPIVCTEYGGPLPGEFLTNDSLNAALLPIIQANPCLLAGDMQGYGLPDHYRMFAYGIEPELKAKRDSIQANNYVQRTMLGLANGVERMYWWAMKLNWHYRIHPSGNCYLKGDFGKLALTESDPINQTFTPDTNYFYYQKFAAMFKNMVGVEQDTTLASQDIYFFTVTNTSGETQYVIWEKRDQFYGVFDSAITFSFNPGWTGVRVQNIFGLDDTIWANDGSISLQMKDVPFVVSELQGSLAGINIWTDKIKPNSARLTWDAVPGAHHYQINGQRLDGPIWIQPDVPYNTPTFKDVFGLANNTQFIWQLRVVYDSLETLVSTWSVFDTFTTACYPPDSLWSGPVASTGARLNWTKAWGSEGYEIQGRHLGASGMTIILIGSGNTLYKDAWGLLPSTAYEWRVRSWCDTAGIRKSEFTEMDTFVTASANKLASANPDAFVVVYPNPFSDQAVVHFANPKNNLFQLAVFDITGKLVFSKDEIRGEFITLEKSDFKSEGMFLMELRGEKLFRAKVLVE